VDIKFAQPDAKVPNFKCFVKRETHITTGTEFGGDMVDGFTQHVALLEERRAMSTGINQIIISYLDLFGPAAASLGQRTTSDEGLVWEEEDPIRISTAAYADIATVLFDGDDENVEKSICRESESSGHKSKRPRSV
jgi:hypothetical protein